MGLGGTVILKRRPAPGGPTGFLQGFAQSARLLRDPVVSAICIIELSTGLVFAFFTAFIVVTAIRRVGLSEPAAISVRMFEGLVAVVTMSVGGFLVKDRPMVWFYRFSLALIVLGFVLLSQARSYPALVITTLFLGCGQGVTSLINVMRLSATEAPKSRVSSLQLFSSMGRGVPGRAAGRPPEQISRPAGHVPDRRPALCRAVFPLVLRAAGLVQCRRPACLSSGSTRLPKNSRSGAKSKKLSCTPSIPAFFRRWM